MNRSVMRNALAVCTCALVAACAASKQEAAAPVASQPQSRAEAGPQAGSSAYAEQAPQAGYPQQPGSAPAAPPPPPAPVRPSETPAATTPSAGGAPARSAQIARAGTDLDRAQRELEIAAGDCSNACRALGSMDRAAGHLCDLVQGAGELRKCDDAKKRVLGARDRVKQTCGTCPNGPSVERSDPVPSTK